MSIRISIIDSNEALRELVKGIVASMELSDKDQKVSALIELTFIKSKKKRDC